MSASIPHQKYILVIQCYTKKLQSLQQYQNPSPPPVPTQALTVIVTATSPPSLKTSNRPANGLCGTFLLPGLWGVCRPDGMHHHCHSGCAAFHGREHHHGSHGGVYVLAS